MSWPRASLYCALLMLAAPWVSADTITVNTTTDDNANNSLCSLREAVEYFNHNKPAKGYQGCKAASSDTNDIVKLPAKSDSYRIVDGHIPVLATLSIEGGGRTGDAITTIQVVGAHRAFVVNFNPDYSPPKCSPNCYSDPSVFKVDSDTDNDYLVNTLYPQFTVVLSGSALPTDQAYLVRVYDSRDGEEPALVGSTTAAFSGGSVPVSITPNAAMSAGVHYLTYTTQVVDAVTGTDIGTESAPSDDLTLAIYADSGWRTLSLSKLILKGGGQAACTALVGCADQAAEELSGQEIVINDFNSPAYDKYALTYTNVLSNTLGNGGIIFSTEKLVLDDVELDGGVASKGGAIYLYGTTDTSGVTPLTTGGGIQLTNSEIRNNTAGSGSAIFAEKNAVVISASLFTENETAAVDGAVVEIADRYQPEESSLGSALIENSTFSANAGGDAVSLQDGMTINSATVVLNSGGVNFNGKSGAVYNSIIAGNPSSGVENNCRNQAVATVEYSLVPISSACLSAGTQLNNQTFDPAVTALIAAQDVSGGCSLDGDGLLCPLADLGGATRVHLPRLLLSYTQLSESPIVNKANSNDLSAVSCPSSDQRGKSRNSGSGSGCDIGAVQLQQVSDGSIARSGDSIRYGHAYSQSLGDNLEDETLLSASGCPAGQLIGADLYPPSKFVSDLNKVVPNTYRSDVPGCPWLETSPGRGTVSFSLTDPDGGVGDGGYYHYQPTSDFHGFDQFYFRVVTTLSFLNSQASGKSRLVSAKVIMEPSESMSSSKVGALDGWWLVAFGLLAAGKRRRKAA